MSWNYRIIKRSNADETTYQIHEVFYDKNGVVDGWSENGIASLGDNKKELFSDLAYMQDAFNKPILMEIGNKLEVTEETWLGKKK